MKVGDSVVIVKKEWSFDEVGDVVVVNRVYFDGSVIVDHPRANKHIGWYYNKEAVVPEHIYNSPLYKALR